MPAASHARILLVDDDAALLGLLQSLLEQEGYAVETVCGLHGFTPDLMALSRPQVVFLNPRIEGMERSVLVGLLHHFRKLQPRASVLLIGAGSADELKKQSADLEADGYVPTAQLLRNPSGELPRAPSAPGPRPAQPDRPRVAELDPEEIVDLELVVPDEPLTRAHPEAPRAPAPAGVSLGAELVKLIEEEVVDGIEIDTVERFEVPLDVLNENNLYGPGPGVVRGVFVAASVRPQIGSNVELAVTFPWGTRYELTGTVEWAQDLPRLAKRSRGGFGVKLPELTALQKAMFHRFAGLRQPLMVAASPG